MKKVLALVLSVVMLFGAAFAVPASAQAASADKVKKVSVVRVSASSVRVKWKKVKKATGYKIQYSTNKKFKKNTVTVKVKNKNAASKKIKGLKKGKTYYFRVRALKKKKASAWSKAQVYTATDYHDTRAELILKVSQQTDEDITEVYYADYDSDGIFELFAITGEVGELGINEIWFSSPFEVKSIPVSSSLYYANRVKANKKQSLFIAEQGAGGSGSSSIWYYVKYGRAYGNDVSFSSLKQDKGTDFTAVGHDFDAMTDEYGNRMGGHTYQTYYFKWTGETFTEYKGTKISLTEFKKNKNASSYLKKIKKLGYTVDSVYKRTNGVINVNVHIKRDSAIYNENVSFKAKGKSLELIVNNKDGKDLVEKSSLGGVYKEGILN